MIRELYIEYFRNIQALKIHPEEGINLIVGDNAAGKTSLLEAIYFLASGRSFRGTPASSLIKFEENHTLIRSKLLHYGVFHQLGMQRSRDELRLKINGETATRISEISRLLPVIAIHPKSDELIIGSPDNRRRFIDQIGFHLFDDYIQITNQFSRVLKQRNSLLKQNAQLGEWQNLFIKKADELEKKRNESIKLFNQSLTDVLKTIMPEWHVEIKQRPGYHSQQTLAEVIAENQDKEYEKQTSLYGPHRADLQITVNGQAIRHVGSRGQIKVLAHVLYLTAARLWEKHRAYQPILLMDDPASELDAHHRQRVFEWLDNSRYQCFITCLTAEGLISYLGRVRVFKLDQGRLID